MQSSLALSFVVCVAVAGSALGQDECGPTPGQRPIRPTECCKVTTLKPTTFQTAMEKCKQKFPMTKPPRPSGPPTGPPPTPSAEMKATMACMVECLYTEEGLMTADKKLNKAAIAKYYSNDATFAPVAAAAVDKCFATYEAEVDASLECKSGAEVLHRCVMKEIFLNCPSSLWTASSDCADLKAKVIKCPQMPFKMGGGGGPPGRPM